MTPPQNLCRRRFREECQLIPLKSVSDYKENENVRSKKTTQMILETRGPLGHGRKQKKHHMTRDLTWLKKVFSYLID